jgi:hypothetical protein
LPIGLGIAEHEGGVACSEQERGWPCAYGPLKKGGILGGAIVILHARGRASAPAAINS